MNSRLGTWLGQLKVFPEVTVDSFEDECTALGPNDRVSIIVFLSSGSEREAIERIARRSRWHVQLVDSWPEGVEILREYKTGVAVVDHHLLGPGWKSSLRLLLGTPQHFSVLLVSPDTTDGFWEEVIREGVYNVLNTPLDEKATVETIHFAWMFWKSCVARACGV